jgi:hypothetical protein
MRFSSLLRLGIAFCSTVLVCLVSVTVVDAAPSRARVVSHRLCSGRSTPCRIKARLPKPRPPAQYLVRVQRVVRRHAGSWIERSRPDPLRENDDAALQDRTAVVSGEDDLLVASLEPIGVLTIPRCPLAISAIVSRHSPRGPPSSPGFV